jgi:hypothetical protein
MRQLGRDPDDKLNKVSALMQPDAKAWMRIGFQSTLPNQTSDIFQIPAYSPLVAVGIVVLKLGAGKGVRDYDHLSYLAGKK